jgi:hypothetical protein
MMKHRTFQFNFRDLNINVPHIARIMGYRPEELHESLTGLILEVLKESEDIGPIRAEYMISGKIHFDNSGKSVEINNLVFDLNKIIFNQIRTSDSIAVFLCTAGQETGFRSREAMKAGDPLKGYIYDVVGSEIVESASELMHNELDKETSAAGKNTTNRFSPGYCGWDVAEQHKLFQLIPGNYCGVSLTSSALMVPVKSVSGFIGIGVKVKRLPYTCNFCDREDCTFRRTNA